MDEEHDVSYKQDSPMPCYDARDVALERVKRNPAKLIFGSATPSMRTWKRVVFEKKSICTAKPNSDFFLKVLLIGQKRKITDFFRKNRDSEILYPEYFSRKSPRAKKNFFLNYKIDQVFSKKISGR